MQLLTSHCWLSAQCPNWNLYFKNALRITSSWSPLTYVNPWCPRRLAPVVPLNLRSLNSINGDELDTRHARSTRLPRYRKSCHVGFRSGRAYLPRSVDPKQYAHNRDKDTWGKKVIRDAGVLFPCMKHSPHFQWKRGCSCVVVHISWCRILFEF